MEEEADGTKAGSKVKIGRDLFMVFLAILSIAILVYDEVATIPPDERYALVVIDALIVLVFAAEFVAGLWRAEDKKAYWKSRWWELPGLLPMAVGQASFLRVFRLVRVIRVVRVLRVISVLSRLRRANAVAKVFLARSHLANVAVVALTLIVTCSYLEFLFEKDSETGHFKTFGDALWWGLVTTTTVGYGDKFPVTVAGRLVAGVLMLTGIGTIGVLAGTFANALIGAASAPPPPKGVEERLSSLASLHAGGKLTDEEFRAGKAKVLQER